jgi:hypothetical protein
MPITTTLHDVTPFALRGLTWLALSETGYITRGTFTDNLGGGASQTFATVGTVACRVDPVGGGEGELAELISDRTTHKITLPPATEIDSVDRFRIAGETFEITAIRTRTDEAVRIVEATKSS